MLFRCLNFSNWTVPYLLFSSKSLALEKPVETAMLTSLTGVKCIIENQWHCTLAENASKLNSTMEGNITLSHCMADSIRTTVHHVKTRFSLGIPSEGK